VWASRSEASPAESLRETALNIDLTRSGGFAGIARTASAPEEELPGDLQETLQSLLAAPPPAAGAPDRFVYTLRHGDREVTVGEKALDPNGKRLMQWLLSRGRG
jgi:hypothetical protein